ncbi:MAG: type I restriction endonuclease subunit R, partial [Candidatus Pacebacteria bacterium]|nr:type I restriction endonuclease subunit R [Candidatus Paceibacterota bacterium]
MTTQSEQLLENKFVKQLEGLGYSYVTISSEKDILNNLKSQLEKHNKIDLTDNEFSKVLNHLDKSTIFERAQILRDRMQLTKDDGKSIYLEFINKDEWCQNGFQVTSQVSQEGSYKNRYDVTILINGLPLVQIELKRRGVELRQAFNQINRYQRHSFGSSYGLFQYIQIFVISNGVNTKYYANNRHQSFKQTFFWADVNNKAITRLEDFTFEFLEPCHLSKMITKYVVLATADKILMVLRPYQYYATEAIIDKVKNSNANGYIWHTTGSGKTLTSFKTSQILMDIPGVHKVVFVVDRKDLDYQTTVEFNNFSKGSVDGTNNTKSLVKQFSDDTKLIVTTIQKLNTAISKRHYLGKMDKLKDKKMIFIFDECHRSQFGETHKRIKEYFDNIQLFGFTGTPIFADNAVKNEMGKRTTKELFGDRLHQYVITDAIRDENVLKFSIEYVGKYKQKEGSKNNVNIEVEGIDTRELMDSPDRLEKISDYIIANHDRKTKAKEFTSIFCVSSVDTLIKYYELFKSKKKLGGHNLKVATIFSYTANQDDKDANGFIPDELDMDTKNVNVHTREKLDEFIDDYNQMFGSKFSTKDSQSFYNYYRDIAKKVKTRKIDVLLVVNMFLTGFDSKTLNTIYVDKNLKYHGLIQAYSRTNRILNERKSQGNIVCFRNLKKATDQAIALFSNKDAKEVIFMKPYEDYVGRFNIAHELMLEIVPTVDSVNDLVTEDDELQFVRAFRELMRIRNILQSFSDFTFADLEMSEQSFEDYKSKYLDIYDKVKGDNEKEIVSILDDVDFELELIHRDEINVVYILRLLASLQGLNEAEKAKQKKVILNLISGDVELRSKKELIEKFIENNLPHIEDKSDIDGVFDQYWDGEQKNAFDKLCKEEGLTAEKVQDVVSNYLFTKRKPLNDEVESVLKVPPTILERKTIIGKVRSK